MSAVVALGRAATAADAGATPPPIRFVVETQVLHRIDTRLFGQFLERPSWGETGPEIAADTNGVLSADVVAMLRAMRIPIVRFPGGTVRLVFPKRSVAVRELKYHRQRNRENLV
jgi:hypothetical protein